MVTIESKYRGIAFVLQAEADQGVKTTMADTLAAIDYLVTREQAGPYAGETKVTVGETTAPDEGKKVNAAEQAEEDTDDREPVSRKTYYKMDDGKLGIVEKGDVLPEGATAIARGTYESLQDAEETAPEVEATDDTDPGDGVDEQAEEAGAKDTVDKKPAPDVSDEDLREAVRAFMDSKGATLTKKLIQEHGADRLSEVPEDKRAALYVAATKGVE